MGELLKQEVGELQVPTDPDLPRPEALPLPEGQPIKARLRMDEQEAKPLPTVVSCLAMAISY